MEHVVVVRGAVVCVFGNAKLACRTPIDFTATVHTDNERDTHARTLHACIRMNSALRDGAV